MNNVPAEQAEQPKITLQQINLKLIGHNLPAIPPSKMNDVLANTERSKLIDAVHKLDNPRALAYVQHVLTAARVMVPEVQEAEEGGCPNDDDQARPASAGELAGRTNFHVYGGKAALCFEEDVTRGGVPTIALDAAASVGNRSYNWAKKTRIQMTRAELPVVASVLLGARAACEFKAHGADKTKGFSLERQAGGKVFVKVFEKDQPVKAVPIEAADVFFVASLVMLQIRRINPWLDASSAMDLVRLTMRQAG